MLGAKLRVKCRTTDLCRANASVSTIILDSHANFIDVLIPTFSANILKSV